MEDEKGVVSEVRTGEESTCADIKPSRRRGLHQAVCWTPDGRLAAAETEIMKEKLTRATPQEPDPSRWTAFEETSRASVLRRGQPPNHPRHPFVLIRPQTADPPLCRTCVSFVGCLWGYHIDSTRRRPDHLKLNGRCIVAGA